MHILQFWTDFWPNLTATLLGLMIGLPIALWTNRIIQSTEKRKELKENEERLISALTIIKDTTNENSQKLSKLLETFKNGKIPFQTGLDVSAWDAVKNDVLLYSHDSNLKRRISAHFFSLNKLVELNTKYLDYAAGTIALIGGAEKTKEDLRKHIMAQLLALQVETLLVLSLIQIRTKSKSMF